MSVFVPELFYVYYYGSVAQFEVRYGDTTSVALFAQDCFNYSMSFVLSSEFQVF
jgi:hypothetical protein